MKNSRGNLIGIAIAATVAVVAVTTMSSRVAVSGESAGSIYKFTDVREQTRQFHTYNRTISLTPEQEAIMEEALTPLEAPCCADRTALTCCCECNMARSWWGLSKHLIADEGRSAEEVRTAVQEWFEYINPAGFSGDSCYTGRCGRPFHENGCGGMKEGTIVF
jgi:hypothetical protein